MKMLDAAIEYVSMGLPIIPLCSHNHLQMSSDHVARCKSPGKSPIVKAWTKRRETTTEEVNKWYSRNPALNMGLVLGESEHWNLVGVDIDGELGEKALAELEARYGDLDTWEFTTGGGRRLLFQLPAGMKTQKHKVCWKEGHEELAFLATGQQTVVPPSMHHKGVAYSWKKGKSPFETDIAMAPTWMQELVMVEKRSYEPEDLPSFYGEQSKPVTSMEYSANTFEGSRSDYMARFVGTLCAKRELPKETIMMTAMQQNQLHCKPPLEDEEIKAMVESIWRSEQEKHENLLAKQRKRQEMNPAMLAQEFYRLQEKKGIIWRYFSERSKFYRTGIKEGPWQKATEDEVEAEIQQYLLTIDSTLAISSKRLEVVRALRLYLLNTFGDGQQLDVGKNQNLDYIAVKNGLLDWRTGKLIDWNPDFSHTAYIEAEWEPDVPDDCDAAILWHDALHSWLSDEETMMFLQEYIGYCFLPTCKMRTAVFLYGEGANGKSLFIDVVQKLFEHSYTVAQLQSLSHRFGTTSLIDKMLIVCSDIDSTYLDKTGVLKQIIAGDEVRAEYKGGKDFSFTPIGKMLFSANRLPKSSDRSYGWYSRLQFVPFERRFEPNQQYYEKVISTMSTEEGRSVLLNWAVEGLQRLMTNKKFTLSDSMLEAKQVYREDNDSVVAFASQALRRSPLDDVSYKNSLLTSAVYLTYRDWCEESGVKSVGKNEFTQRIHTAGFETGTLSWKTSGGWRSKRSILNAQLADIDEFETNQNYQTYVALGG